MTSFLNGMNVMACIVAALFFFRFWTRAGDRLFAGLGAAFLLLAVNWLALAVMEAESEYRPLVYALRLVAFLVIIASILDKNLKQTRSSRNG